MEFTGDASRADHLVVRGDPDEREFIAFWLADGRVVAGMNVNVWDVTDEIERLIHSHAVVDTAELLDPDRPLAEVSAREAGRAAA